MTLRDNFSNNNIYNFATLTFFLAVLSPEYIAPIFTVVLFILTLKNKKQHNNITHSSNIIGLTIVILIAFKIVMSYKTNGIVTSSVTIGLWILMFLGYFSFTKILDSENKILSIINFGCYSAGFGGIIGFVQFVFNKLKIKSVIKLINPFWRFIDVLIQKIVAIFPNFIKSYMPSTTFKTFAGRSCGTLSNPLFYATLEIFLMPFAAYVFINGDTKKKRIIGLICLISSLMGIASSYSRAPYVYTILTFILLFLYGRKSFKKLFAVAIFSTIYILTVGKEFIFRLATVTNSNETSVSTRKKVWLSCFDMLKKNPISGYGTGFDNIRQQLHNNYKVMQPHAHNIFLQEWLETGILGVIILGFLFLVSVFLLFLIYKKGNVAKDIAITLFASLSGFVMCGMTDCLFYGLKPLQYLMMLLGLITATSNIYLTKNDIKKVKKLLTRRKLSKNENTLDR